jgi:hypothetical protein
MTTSVRSVVVRKGDATSRFTKLRIDETRSQSTGRIEGRVDVLLTHSLKDVLLKLATDLVS